MGNVLCEYNWFKEKKRNNLEVPGDLRGRNSTPMNSKTCLELYKISLINFSKYDHYGIE